MNYNELNFRLIGGRTCLDFLNTANWSAEGDLIADKLGGEDDLSLWCHAAGLPDNPSTDRLQEFRFFRAALRRLFLASLAGELPAKGDLAALNNALASIPSRALRAVSPPVLTVSAAMTLPQAVAVSAMAVLSQASEIARVRVCPGQGCAWLFLDESRNRRRRWCSMEACGNREKARRHYQRKTV